MIPQFSQLFIYSPDKSKSVCKIFITTPSLDKEQTLGRLFGIIEIESPDRALWDTIETLAANLEKDYYGEDNIQLTLGKPSKAVSIEETFEKSIQTFNDKLIELIKGGKLANLLDRISILVGTFKEGNIYFAAVGSISAFVIHQSKSQEYRLINVLETTGGQENKINPFKILSNVINGQISGNDSLLFCNNNLLDYLSLDKIKQTLTTQEPAAATRHLKDLLLEASINTTFAAVIIKLAAASATQRSGKEIKLPQKSLEHLVTTERTTEAYLSPPLKFNLVKYSSLITAKTKKVTLQIYQKSLSYLQERKNRKPAKPPRVFISTDELIEEEEEEAEEIKKTNEIPKPSLSAQAGKPLKQPRLPDRQVKSRPGYQLASPDAERFNLLVKKSAADFIKYAKKAIWRFGSLLKSLYYIISNQSNRRQEMIQKLYADFIHWLANLVKKFKSLPRLSQILVVACLILFILFVQSIVLIGKSQLNKTAQSNFNQALAQIEQNRDSAEGALIYNDANRASQLLSDSRKLLAQLKPSGKDQKQKFADVGNELNALSLKLQHVTEAPTALVADLDSQVSNQADFSAATLTLINGGLYTVNDLKNSFYLVNPADKSTKSLASQSDNPKIKLAAAYGNNIIYYHGGNGLVQLDTAQKTAGGMSIDLKGKENKVTDIGSYNGYFYVLAAQNNQIYRFNKAGAGFGPATNWLKDGSIIKDASGLTIDGDVYLVMSTGEIQKFTSGKKQDFSITNLETKISSGAKIWTTAKSTALYVLDPANQRLLIFDKSTGKIKNQYLVKNLNQLKNAAIDEKAKKAYLLDGNKVYQINL